MTKQEVSIRHTTCPLTKTQKIDKIYKEIANKELSFGCKIKEFRNYEDNNIFNYRLCRSFNSTDGLITHIKVDTNKLLKVEIIGHDVMIGDCLYYIENKPSDDYPTWYGCILGFWKDKRLPIEMQSDEVISYIFNLLNEGKQ